MDITQNASTEKNPNKLYEYADDIIYSVRCAESEDFRKVRDAFSCGNEVIDHDFVDTEFDWKYVSYVVTDDSNGNIIAIYSLSCSACVYSIYDKNYFSPSAEIALFAVDQKYQDIKFKDGDDCLSSAIFSELIYFIFTMTDDTIGATKIVLYATPNAVPFYSKCGFVEFQKDMLQNQDRYLDGCTPMYTDIR